jgi:hypothetical protein
MGEQAVMKTKHDRITMDNKLVGKVLVFIFLSFGKIELVLYELPT